ncbi:MAG: signal recognition particle-docking protein FtsY [Desulfobacterales bacterium]|nr:signal recognition particle-docking protein FtsY [Desulfobacterales bacterium]
MVEEPVVEEPVVEEPVVEEPVVEEPVVEEPVVEEPVVEEPVVEEPVVEEPVVEEPVVEEPVVEEPVVEEPVVEEAVVEEAVVEEPKAKGGFFSRLKQGLTRTRQAFGSNMDGVLKTGGPITEDLFEELEEILVTSDMGMTTAMDMMERIRKKAKKLSYADELKAVLKEEILNLFPPRTEQDETQAHTPQVIMVVGVNGAGKTTTLGKLATRFTREGKKVLLVAADTFRAAAIEQLEIWAERSESGIVKHREGSDPAAVAYDGIAAAVARKVDVVLVDTAGRLHTQKNLMEELKKIKRTIDKKFKGAPHEVLMVLDATTGQNAISQAKIFHGAVDVTQFALTKLDGTAKGGIAAAVAGSMGIPIQYIGVGEGIEDLQDFDAEEFVDAIFEE